MRRLRTELDKDDTIIRRHRRRRPRPRPHRRLRRRRCRRRAVVADHRRDPVEKAWRRRVRAPLHLVRRGRHASVEFLSPVRLHARSLVSLSTSSFSSAYCRVRSSDFLIRAFFTLPLSPPFLPSVA